MRRVLVFYFSQTGQLERLVRSICRPILQRPGIEVDLVELSPVTAFPFPWPFGQFFSIFPEAVQMRPIALRPLGIDPDRRYDLIVLGYQVWFLSPSLPTSSLLKSANAQRLFRDTPVVTVIGCRNMWLMAQMKVRKELARLEARLVDNVVLTDRCGTGWSFLSTPLWMFTGRRKPYRWVPEAGIPEHEIDRADRFGRAIVRRLLADDDPIRDPMLKGLGAVKIDPGLIASEKIGHRSFLVWSRLLRLLGPPGSIGRNLGLSIYIVFLLLMVITVVPATGLLKRLLRPLLKDKIEQQRAYFAQPSGEE